MKGPILAFDATTAPKNPLPSFLQRPGPGGAAMAADLPADDPVTAGPLPDTPRADAALLALYAGLLGENLGAADLAERMVRDGIGALDPDTAARLLTGAGLAARVRRVRRLTQDLWPALAETRAGALVLVLDQRGGRLFLHDPAAPDGRAEIAVADFAARHAGAIVRAEPRLAALARRHGAAGRARHWFWGQFARFRRNIAEVALASFVANLLAVAVALFSLQVYDRVIPHQSTATLWVLAIGAGLALGFEAALRIARARLMDGAGRRIELSVQALLMDRLLGMRADARQPPAQTAAAVRDFGSIREFFTASTVGTLTDLPFIVLFLALVAAIGGPVVWILIAGGILMVLPAFPVQRRMVALTQATQGAGAKAGRVLNEVLYEADTLRAHRGEDRFRRLWSELTELSTAASSEQRRIAAALTSWAQGVQQASYIAAVVAGAYLVFAGQFTVGSIIAIGILTSRTLAPLTQLATMLARWSNVKAALQALDRVALAPQDEDAGRSYLRRDRLQGRYELRELIHRHDEDGPRALDIAGVIIEPGQRVALLGVNGSGKSTLLRVLAGLALPTAGRVMIDGVDMAQVMPRDLRRNIGWLGQEVRLFAGTLRDNLNLGLLERDDDRLLAALDFAGLGAHVRAHPRGLDLVIRDGGEGLSVGQRQSVGWARLWLADPRIVLLDEPTAAMDQTLEATLVARLERWLTGRTAVIATHRVPILNLANRVMVMQAGRIVVDGPRDDVLRHLARGGRTAAAAGTAG